MRLLRNWVANRVASLGMAIASAGDTLYDCRDEDYFEPDHINHDCHLTVRPMIEVPFGDAAMYRKGDC